MERRGKFVAVGGEGAPAEPPARAPNVGEALLGIAPWWETPSTCLLVPVPHTPAGQGPMSRERAGNGAGQLGCGAA